MKTWNWEGWGQEYGWMCDIENINHKVCSSLMFIFLLPLFRTVTDNTANRRQLSTTAGGLSILSPIGHFYLASLSRREYELTTFPLNTEWGSELVPYSLGKSYLLLHVPQDCHILKDCLPMLSLGHKVHWEKLHGLANWSCPQWVKEPSIVSSPAFNPTPFRHPVWLWSHYTT